MFFTVRKLFKRGDCPYIPSPARCISKPIVCNYDIDCGQDNDEKCCSDSCNKRCARAANLPRPATPAPVVPTQGRSVVVMRDSVEGGNISGSGGF